MLIKLITLLYLLSSLIDKNQCADILLLVPLRSDSFYHILKPLVKILLDRGHNITAVSAISFPYHHNIRQVLVKSSFNYALIDHSITDDPRSTLLNTYEVGYMVTEEMFKNKEFQALLLQDRTFDLVISTDLPLCYAIAAVEHRFNAHGITILNHDAASQVSWILGEYFNPAYQPATHYAHAEQAMTFQERLYNFYVMGMTLFITYSWILPLHESLLKSFSDDLPFLKDRPSLTNIISNKSLILIPIHHAVQNIYTHSPRTRHIAGICIERNNSLPKVFDNFMSNSPGVILVNSDLSLLNKHKARKFEKTLLSVFSRLMLNVIWKHNLTSQSSLPRNVMVTDWLPQQEILAHKNLNLFMTHGGLNSIMEATYYGVPLIITPFSLEHYKNIKKVFNSGAGIVVDSENLSAAIIRSTIFEISNNPKYRESAMRRSKMFRDRFQNPLDEAVYWIEYVFKYGNILKPATSTMPQYQVFLLDIVAFIVLIIIIAFYLCRYIFKFIFDKTAKVFYYFQSVSKKNK